MQTNYTYTITVTTTRSLGSMNMLLDAIEQEFARQGIRPAEWEAEVHGPPELSIGLRYQ